MLQAGFYPEGFSNTDDQLDALSETWEHIWFSPRTLYQLQPPGQFERYFEEARVQLWIIHEWSGQTEYDDDSMS